MIKKLFIITAALALAVPVFADPINSADVYGAGPAAAAINPFDPQALRHLALAKWAQGDTPTALQLLQRAKRFAPNDSGIDAMLDRLRSGQAPVTLSALPVKQSFDPRGPLLQQSIGRAYSEIPALWSETAAPHSVGHSHHVHVKRNHR